MKRSKESVELEPISCYQAVEEVKKQGVVKKFKLKHESGLEEKEIKIELVVNSRGDLIWHNLPAYISKEIEQSFSVQFQKMEAMLCLRMAL